MRDYSLLGDDSRSAIDSGLATAEWYHTDIERSKMKALMQRSDQPAIRDTALWLGSMVLFAGVGIYLWPSAWAYPCFLAYGVLYGSGGDSRWHECGHGTAFKTRWMNQVVYQIASFMMVRNPVTWRWSHARHHTDTIIVGRDPEIALMRPPNLLRALLNLFGIVDSYNSWKAMLRNSIGQLSGDEKNYVPESERPALIRTARVWTGIYSATVLLAVATGSILPLLIIGLPRLYGAWHHILTGLLQHGGLAEDVLDHRLNSRTVLMNPLSRFIYWNMNYHVEHHMFPMVPYHALPNLHELIKDDLPAPNTSIAHAYKEVLPAWRRQMRNERWFIKRELPPTAKPYATKYRGDLKPTIDAAA